LVALVNFEVNLCLYCCRIMWCYEEIRVLECGMQTLRRFFFKVSQELSKPAQFYGIVP